MPRNTPKAPVDQPPLTMTMNKEVIIYKLKIKSALQRLSTNSVSTDFCPTRKMAAITRVPNTMPKNNIKIEMPLIIISIS